MLQFEVCIPVHIQRLFHFAQNAVSSSVFHEAFYIAYKSYKANKMRTTPKQTLQIIGPSPGSPCFPPMFLSGIGFAIQAPRRLRVYRIGVLIG